MSSDDRESMLSAPSLKICLVSRALPVHRLGGLEYHARDLAIALLQRGHEVHIITSAGGAAQELTAENRSVTIHEIPHTRPGNYSLSFFRNAPKMAQQVCHQFQIDILCPIDLTGLLIKPRDFTAAVIPLIHGTMTSEVPLDWRYRRHLSLSGKLAAAWRYKSRLILWYAFRKMIRKAETIIVDSEFTRRELYLGAARNTRAVWETGNDSALLAQKIHVVPLGIDTVRYPVSEKNHQATQSHQCFRIVLLGRFQRIKGLEQAIRVAAALKIRGVHFQMTIGGGGDFSDEAQLLVQTLNLSEHVKLVGRVAPDKLGEFMAENDVFLFPDLTQPAFGLVAVEAMGYRLPVVAAKSGAIPEVVIDESGWLYDPWDVDGLAALLQRLAVNVQEVREKSLAAYTRSSIFTAAKMAERTEEVFKSAGTKRK